MRLATGNQSVTFSSRKIGDRIRRLIAIVYGGAVLGITEKRAFKVSQHDVIGSGADEIAGRQRNFPATTWSVDNVSRNCQTCGVSTHRFNNFDSLPNAGTQMIGAHNRIALIEVVRPHANAQKRLAEISDRFDIVIDSREQHGLIAQRNSQPGQLFTALRGFFGNLARMIEMSIDPKRPMLIEQTQ